ncbi:GerMN domain-containing protein [Streptomyces sp. R35]|uniref:GerMN domain-containing protein n=1 Tax=Streptomyces sp. R35 TaxID=3238630 RepID=A0AB39S1T7_9ACTN
MNSEAPVPCPRRRHSLVLTAAALTLPLLAASGCGTGTGPDRPQGSGRPAGSPTGTSTSGGASGTPAPSGTTSAKPATPEPSVSTSAGAHRIRTAVYFLRGEYVSAAPRTVTAPATATSAVRELLSGPNRYEADHGRTTAIPSGTKLHSVVVRGHVATVDLSSRYDDGGGSLSMRARLAQVVFTMTRFAGVHEVRFELDGKPVKHFGGEGIVLNGPVGRADFEDLAPAVLVESPLIGDTVHTPVRVWGSANTFEAEFRLKVTDTTGRTSADVQIRATSGTGARGTFDVAFPYKAARTGPGLLIAYLVPPKDGRPVIVDTVPLTVNR